MNAYVDDSAVASYDGADSAIKSMWSRRHTRESKTERSGLSRWPEHGRDPRSRVDTLDVHLAEVHAAGVVGGHPFDDGPHLVRDPAVAQHDQGTFRVPRPDQRNPLLGLGYSAPRPGI